MQHAHDVAMRYLKAEASRSKASYDIRPSYHNYEVGDAVWMLHEARKVGTTPKLEKKYDGPYLITERRSAVNFRVQFDAKGADKLVHHDKLKKV